ncbi:MAG TPA: hypothetical protein VI408_10250 [Gaiellaceae bacterium]
MRTSIALLAAAAAVVPVAAAHSAAATTLVASVGKHDAFTIALTTASGKRVTSLPAGRYVIVVHDYSAIHNFALGSVTANKRIFTGSVPGVGTKTYRVTLTPGKYAYACSAHPTTMHGSFSVR